MSIDLGDLTVAGPLVGAAPATGAPVAIERERAAARASGYAAGWASGAQAAHAAARRQLDADLAELDAERASLSSRLGSAAAALERAAAQVDAATVPGAEQVADTVLEVALQLAAAVLGHEAIAAQAPGRAALRRALVAGGAGTTATVRLHPADAATLTAEDVPVDVTVVADPTLAQGDSVLRHGGGSVEVLLQAGLERARTVLLG